MSQNDAVQKEIIEPMLATFSPPRQMDEGQLRLSMLQYVDALHGFAPEDLREAWTAIRDSQATRTWPAPAAFVQAARKARNDRQPQKQIRAKLSDEAKLRWERWGQAKMSVTAQDAAKRGVAWAFKCAILGGQDPQMVNLAALERAKNSATDTALAIERGESVWYKGRQLKFDEKNTDISLRMWRQILVKNAETEKEIAAVRN